MTAISIRREHDLGLERARALSEQVAEQLGQEYGLCWQWQGEQLLFEHASVRGHLLASEQQIRIELRLSLALLPVAALIRTHVSRQLDQYIDQHA